MSEITPSPLCPICGGPIPPKKGIPRQTCSEPCRKKRAAARELERYARVKDTEAWQSTRAGYLDKLSYLKKTDEALRERLAEAHRAAVRKHTASITQSPSGRSQFLEKKRDYSKIAADKRNSDPLQREAYLAKQRRWYQSLSEDEKARIYYEPRKYRTFREKKLGQLIEAARYCEMQSHLNIVKAQGSKTYWSQNEVSLLKEMYAKTPAKDIAAVLKRTPQAVRLKALTMGIEAEFGRHFGPDSARSWKVNAWDRWEDQFLKEFYGKYSSTAIAQALERSKFSVKARIKVLKLKQG